MASHLSLRLILYSFMVGEVEFLGTGTSTGVPQLRCGCEVCHSADARDNRLRSSVIVRVGGVSLLIDCGPDFRSQMLRASDDALDALLITHSHYDHVGGIDDLRPYCLTKDSFPIYCQDSVANDLYNRIPYCFAAKRYPGVPTFDVNIVEGGKPFNIGGVEVEPLPIMHLSLPILGFRFGNFAYITDAKSIDDTVIDSLRGIDLIVINALRHKEHISHLSLAQTLEIIERINPNRAYLTHISHDMGLQADIEPTLPANVHFAYDRLKLTF